MAISVKALGNHIRLALGDLPRHLSVTEIVNDAGRVLEAAHTWEWLSRRSTTISTVADQPYVDAPSDFRSIIEMYPTNSLTNQVQWTTLHEILRLRSTVVGSYTGYWAAANHRAVANAAPQLIFELWPTPNTSAADYFTIMYQGKWTEVSSDNDWAAIPDYMNPLFADLVRRVARAWEEEDTAGLMERVESLKQSSLWVTAMQTDGLNQPTLGTTKGGAASDALPDIGRVYVTDTVASPNDP